MFKWRRLYSYFLAALAFSALVIFLVAYARRWNQPNTAPVTIYDGAVVNGTTPLQVKITCDCPEAFVVPGTQNIRLTVSVKPQQSAAIQPQQAPQIQPKQGPPLPAGKSTTSAQSTPVPMNVWVWLDPSSISLVDPADTTAKWINFSLGSLTNLPKGLEQSFSVRFITSEASFPGITFRFQTVPSGSTVIQDYNLGFVSWNPKFHQTFWSAFQPFIYGALVLVVTFVAILLIDRQFRNIRNEAEAKLAEAQSTWEKARIKLDAYFNRNLLQVNMVFWVAVLVVFVGFGFVLGGVVLSFQGKASASLVAAISGIITQFIGATFMVIYRSTMAQANDFMAILERINTVDMAVQVLDKIPDTKEDLKDEVRAQMVSLLTTWGRDTHPFRPSRKKDSTSRDKKPAG